MYCKTQPRLLVVIDMQPAGFPLSRVVTAQVLREIDSAIEQGWTIAIVEFEHEVTGPTDERILERLQSSGYDHWLTVKKKQEDGSAEILAAAQLSREDAAPLFRIVGVTTDDCVTKTAHGLSSKRPDCQVEVVKDACTNWEGHRFNWSAFSHADNVKVV